MTTHDVFRLRKQGHIEQAYQAIRQIYASDKSPEAAKAMFWTAVDVLRNRVEEGNMAEAEKILLALQRMMPFLPDRNGWAEEAFSRCQLLLANHLPKPTTTAQKADHAQTGDWGEELAAAYLRDKGYIIVDRDWRSGHRDIDIVARDDEYLVFVEVKTRSIEGLVNPAFAVDQKKMNNIKRAITHYVNYHNINIPYRFDIVTIVGRIGCDNPAITHIEDVSLVLSPSEHYRSRRRQ